MEPTTLSLFKSHRQPAGGAYETKHIKNDKMLRFTNERI
jgi:hypothetical protein